MKERQILQKKNRRSQRVRASLRRSGWPRLSVSRSNRAFSAQIIDDTKGHTLVSILSKKAGTSDPAVLGEKIAALAKEKNIEHVVFDRGSYRYHGKIKAFAEAVRKGGLIF